MRDSPTRPTLSALLVLLVLLAGCSSPDSEAPVAAQSGAELFASQNCALCHGADGRSAFWRPGPDLLPNLAEWTAPALAAYLADPLTAAAGIERLDGSGMPGYPHLSVEERLRLATYVLSLAAPAEG